MGLLFRPLLVVDTVRLSIQRAFELSEGVGAGGFLWQPG